PEDVALREDILKFIGDFANWDNAGNPTFLGVGRDLVKAAYPEENPLVVDPFAGGGSIPLEALRLGCETFASDLNPVACLILRVMLEDIPRHGPELAEDLRRVSVEIEKKVEQELAEFYPKDPDDATPIAYLWARTVKCESPNCGAEIPLIRSFWLCKKENRKIAFRYEIIRHSDSTPFVKFEIFEPATDAEVPKGTVNRAKATCLCCDTVLPPERVRAQLTQQRGGVDAIFDQGGRRIGGACLMAVVTLRHGERERHYRLPEERDYTAVKKARERLKQILDDWERGGKRGLCPAPNESAPSRDTHRAVGSQLPLYGYVNWGDLYTRRQLVLISTFVKHLKNMELLPMALSKVIRHCNAFSFWHKGSETVAGAFGRHAIPMCWDFPEYYPFHDFAGGWESSVKDIVGTVHHINQVGFKSVQAQVEIANATSHPLPDDSAMLWFTDPPYYDAIPYADLSDFFFVWLKRAVSDNVLLRDPFDTTNILTPKKEEIVQCEKVKNEEGQGKDKNYYENAMALAFAEGRRVTNKEGIGSVVFAHKTTEGWEALLSGIIRGGWTVTASWPVATERKARLLARNTAALATSVHLVCRPRLDDAPVGDWGEVLHELPQRVGNWIEYLQEQGVRGADLVFACIGPALEIFSRYSKVETAEGEEVKLDEYLEKVWEVVGRIALEQVLGTAEARARNGAAGALEEDARLTALFLWTIQSTNGQNGKNGDSKEKSIADDEIDDEDEEVTLGGESKGYRLVFDVVRRFAQPLGIDLPKWENRIIETEKGVVRLLPVNERARQLFGTEGTETAAEWIASEPQVGIQLLLFPEVERERVSKTRGRGRRKVTLDPSALESTSGEEMTTLDRVHAAMLLQASGQTNALRALVGSEVERGPDFLRLANALSALYPKGSEEKRLLDAMLLAMPR
ncbi:MAG: DUF1156 domain-containing protein, partial [Firmicutes bacterium]|nr:DUF1156 domain-containing protein [Bacillota bacterium]